LRVPSIAVMPREGSFALTRFGRIRKVHESAFARAAGRKSFALKRIEVLVICFVSSADYADFRRFLFRKCGEGNLGNIWITAAPLRETPGEHKARDSAH
jgi:hypothetical protein